MSVVLFSSFVEILKPVSLWFSSDSQLVLPMLFPLLSQLFGTSLGCLRLTHGLTFSFASHLFILLLHSGSILSVNPNSPVFSLVISILPFILVNVLVHWMLQFLSVDPSLITLNISSFSLKYLYLLTPSLSQFNDFFFFNITVSTLTFVKLVTN